MFFGKPVVPLVFLNASEIVFTIGSDFGSTLEPGAHKGLVVSLPKHAMLAGCVKY